MKRNIKFIIHKSNVIMIAGVFAFSAMSCSDLMENPKALVSEVNFYNTKGEAEAGLVGAMSQASAAADVTLGPDDVRFNSYKDSNHDGVRDFPIVLQTDYGVANWTAAYKSIANTNAVLRAANSKKITGVSESELAEIIGQAKFIRAFNYFNLVRLYGDVPLIKEDSPNPVSNTYTRAGVASVYSQISLDLEDAAKTLPDSWANTPGRPTKWVAKGLLSKVYLTMATAPLKQPDNYAKAATLAKEVIDSKKFTLIPNVADVFKIDSKRESEMMFAFEATTDAPSGAAIGLASKNSGGYSGGAMDTIFAAHEFPDQPRRDAYVQLNIPDVIHPDANGNWTLIPWKKAFEYAPIIAKYNYPYVDANDIAKKAVWPMNFPILRYADVLLVYAEAANRVSGKPTTEAVNAINLVINRANGATGHESLATIGMTIQAFEDKVIMERKFEFCFELGNRWFDMVRKELTKNHITTTLFPIPEFDAKVLGQNPGY